MWAPPCDHPLLRILVLLAAISSAHPSQPGPTRTRSTRNQADDDFFGGGSNDFFGGSFNKMDEEERVHSKIDEGFDMWEKRCMDVGGPEVLNRWLRVQEDLVHCAMENFDVAEIQREMEIKMKTGDLDLVFKKYCGAPVKRVKPCIEELLRVSRLCLHSKDQESLNTTMGMVDTAIGFLCHNSGDRMAMFMAEKGAECLTDHKEAILQCVNTTFPELYLAQAQGGGTRRRSVDPVMIFNEDNCRRGDRLRQCVEHELLRCEDPTPSNVVNAMMVAMWNTTPCSRMSAGALYSSGGSSRYPPPHHVLHHVHHLGAVSLIVTAALGRLGWAI